MKPFITLRKPKPGQTRFSPALFIIEKNRLASMLALLLILHVAYTHYKTEQMVRHFARTPFACVIDSAGIPYPAPLTELMSSEKLHVVQAKWSTLALLSRNPIGIDYPELLSTLYQEKPLKKAKDLIESEKREYRSKNIHAKPEIESCKVLGIRSGHVRVSVVGQILRVGDFELEKMKEPIPFQIIFRMVKNPNLLQSAQFPTLVSDFSYQPRSTP